jgi:hypothetical protein
MFRQLEFYLSVTQFGPRHFGVLTFDYYSMHYVRINLSPLYDALSSAQSALTYICSLCSESTVRRLRNDLAIDHTLLRDEPSCIRAHLLCS